MTPDTGSPELLPALLASVGDGVYVVSPDGAVAFVNPAGLAILGYEDADELLGRPSHSTIHAPHRDGSPYPEDACPLLRPRESGEAVQVDDTGSSAATARWSRWRTPPRPSRRATVARRSSSSRT